jgi:GAF domain-containing protein
MQPIGATQQRPGWSTPAVLELEQATVDLAPTATSARARDLFERVVVCHRRSAFALRAHGRDREAARAEAYAARVRLLLDRPRATERMFRFARAVARPTTGMRRLLDNALDGALALMGAELGNIQLNDPRAGALRIAVSCGFDSEFLEYFAVVDDEGSACGRAAQHGSQTVISDVEQDAAFACHREIAAAAGFRAVQSTPIVDPDGRLRGVLSTHFRRRHRPSPDDLELIAWYGELIGRGLAHQPPPSPSPRWHNGAARPTISRE